MTIYKKHFRPISRPVIIQPSLSQRYNNFDKTSATRLRLTWQPTRQDWLPRQHFFSKNNYNTDFVRRNTHSNTDSNTQTNSGPVTTATIPYIRGTSETIARILQPYNIRVAHKPITTLRRLLTNVKDKDKLEDRQGAVYKIKCCNCQASYIGETGRNLSTRLTEHKRATRNGDVNNHIAEHHLQTKHQIDWDSATCITYSTDYYQRLTLESWFTNLEQTPLNRSQQLPAPYKCLTDGIKQN